MELAFKSTRTRHTDKRAAPADAAYEFQPIAFSFRSRASSSVIHRKASCACGGRCPACQAKRNLNISQPNDPAEIEADQIADKVMRMAVSETKPIGKTLNSPNTIHRKCFACGDEEETLQRKALPSGGGVPSQSPAHVQSAIGSGGRPLSDETRSFFEPRFGFNLSALRVHTGAEAAASADALDARAYTLGSDIVFGPNQFAPETREGKSLLAHELAHAVGAGGNSGAIHRKKRGAAGGCGICIEATEAGQIAHTEIRLAFAAANPDIRSVEFAVPVVEAGKVAPFVPKVDLSYDTHTSAGKVINIGEIKPLDDADVQVGIAREKLKDYARELKANPALGYDEVFRMRDAPPTEPIPFFNLKNPPLCPPQVIYVKLTEPGIYQYYCEPPWSDLVKNPQCKCQKRKDEKKDEKDKVVEKPQTEEKKKEEKKEKKITDTLPSDESTGIEPYVVPAVIGVGVSAATAAYIRKRMQEAALKRAALAAEQAAWRKIAEAAAAKRAAAAAGKGVAGKAAGKAVAYVEIAAAAALIVLFPDRVEAKPGLGPSAIESLYKAMTTNGTPPSAELKELIESDPVLKQLAEEAGSTGDASKLQEEITRRTLQLIKDNPGMFTAEDLEFFAEFSKTADSSRVKAPETAEQLKAAIEAAKAGVTGGEGGTGVDLPAKEPAVKEKPPTETGKSAESTDSNLERFKKLNDESKKKIKEASKQVSQVFQKFLSEQKSKPKLDDNFVKRFFEIIPADLTDNQAETLIGRFTDSPGQTPEAMLEALRKAVEDLKKEVEESTGDGTGDDTSAANQAGVGKTREQIIDDLKKIAGTLSFKSGKNNVYRFSINKEIIDDARAKSKGKDGVILETYIFGKNQNGVGVVALLTGSLPADIDAAKLKKGSRIAIEIISVSPFVDKQGNVYEISLKGPLIIGL